MRRSTRKAALAGRLVLFCGLALAASSCGSCEDNTGKNTDGGGAFVGDAGPDAEDPLFDGIGEHTVEGGVGLVRVLPHTPALDILWVIDNSGSMCDPQEVLRRNFEESVLQLAERGVDFQVGVTTTQMRTVPLSDARPAELQTEPTPSVTFPACLGDEGDPNIPDDGYEPLRRAMADAVACTKNPEEWQHLLEFTDDEITCRLRGECGNYDEVFPQPGDDGESPYRETPRVVRSTDYDAVNKVDVDRLARDFSCLSMVGTSGYGIEKGLGAAVEAVSPEKTGGAVEDPIDESAPNHGLVRQNASFALIFLTDENDCTHDGSLPENSVCGGGICAFANHPDFPDSPLIEPAELADQFVENLSASKGREIRREDILAASFHGTWRRYGATDGYPEGDAPMNLDLCEGSTEPAVNIKEQESCSSEMGVAYSGDRYERFLREFPNFYPYADEDEHIPGTICDPSRIPDELAQLGEFAAARNPHCIDRDLLPCTGDSADACPDFRFGDGSPTCVESRGGSVCESALELELLASGADAADQLEQTGFCVPESIGDDGCIIDRAKYEVAPCADGLGFQWVDDGEVNRELDGFVVRVRYLMADWEPEGE